ncbi:hypothetical protein [Wolbachia endosymbiont (group A) of Chalcis sispes]|uniref:hypothetical protein n=1 Tax=Wolbachia endosymbiont (group A) of Chalcis sispes TaxID=3066197 RepID=UPI003132E259
MEIAPTIPPTIPTTRGDGVVRLNIISGRDIIDSIIEITPTVFSRDRNPFESKCSLIPLNNIKKMLIHAIAQSITAAIFIIAADISAAK